MGCVILPKPTTDSRLFRPLIPGAPTSAYSEAFTLVVVPLADMTHDSECVASIHWRGIGMKQEMVVGFVGISGRFHRNTQSSGSPLLSRQSMAASTMDASS